MSAQRQPSTQLEREYAGIRRQFQAISLVAVTTIVGGSVFYHLVEKLNWVDSVYFTVVTLGTVGYGDIVPHTDLGKIFTSFYILFGIGIIAGFANILIKHAVIKRRYRSEQKQLNER